MLIPLVIAGAGLLLLSQGKPPRPPTTLYVLGDSQVANQHFIRTLDRLTDTQVFGAGKGGWGIKALRKKFLGDILSRKPEMVLLWAGVNDISSKRSGEYVRDQALELARAIAPIPLVMVTIPAWGRWRNPRAPGLQPETRRANDLIRGALPYVDAAPLSINPNDLNPRYTNEGLHFNKRGHEALSELVIRRLNLVRKKDGVPLGTFP